ncbi:MAG: hypothetical protein ACI4XS_05670 [Bacillus sp. (in: firmicutes)]
MKKRTRSITAFLVLLIAFIYFAATPTGALRFAIMKAGYPTYSLKTIEVSDTPYEAELESNQTMYSLVNPPIDEATQGVLENWVVSKYGVFYWGDFYGW